MVTPFTAIYSTATLGCIRLDGLRNEKRPGRKPSRPRRDEDGLTYSIAMSSTIPRLSEVSLGQSTNST